MNILTIPVIIIFVLLIATLIIAIPALKLKQEEFRKTGKHPKGHYIGMWIALGIPLGMPFGIATGNIALGPAIGVAIGVAIGTALEKKHEKELRPLTEKEKQMQQRGVLLGTGILVLGVIALVMFYFFAGK